MIEKNPIDKDKVSDMPGLLEYAHHVGSAIIKPEDSGKIKSRALTAMREQTNMQVKNIYEQMQLLANQMNDIKKGLKLAKKYTIPKCVLSLCPAIPITFTAKKMVVPHFQLLVPINGVKVHVLTNLSVQ